MRFIAFCLSQFAPSELKPTRLELNYTEGYTPHRTTVVGLNESSA